MIQVFKPSLGDEEIEALRDIFASGWIGLGPKTAEFEKRFAEYVGAKHAVAVNSATAALHLACLALGIGPGDEVLVPAITFISTAHAPSYCGATVVFVDVDPKTLIIDIADLKRKITPRTKAVIPVHFGGHAAPMEQIWEIAEAHKLLVIEDAAHACGTEYKGKKVGGLERSHATCFSFHAVKNLATGDGGMITFSRDDLVRKLSRLRWVGIDKSTWDRTEEVLNETGARRFARYGWYYEVQELGYKYHMNDIAAAIGLVQLRKLDAMNARRREIAERYTELFDGIDWIECPVERAYTRSAWHNYVIKTPYRDAMNLHLKDHGVATGVHYMPVHLHPLYRNLDELSLPVSERVWTSLLTLPLYPDLTDEQVRHIVDAVISYPAANRKVA